MPKLLAVCGRIDRWLQRRLGRPYGFLLTGGLTVEIVRRLAEMPAHAEEAPRLAGSALIVLLNLALLVHQLGELGDRFSQRAGRGQGAEP